MKKYICPKCKSDNVVPIRYGEPVYQSYEEMGKVRYGGCIMASDGSLPDMACEECNYEWNSGEEHNFEFM